MATVTGGGIRVGAPPAPPPAALEERALAELVSAAHRTRARPVSGRLAGGFRWAPHAENAFQPTPELRIAAARLEQAALALPTGAALAALGRARLLLADVDGGVVALEDAVAREPGVAAFHNDLAVAYLERASKRRRFDDYPRALAAAERALRASGDLTEARFNAALALENLHLESEAQRMWSACVEAGAPEWAPEARARLERIRNRPQPESFASVRGRLLEVKGGDSSAAPHMVLRWRQETREWIEDEILPEWAVLVRKGDFAGAERRLSQAAEVANELAAAGGDTMPRDGIGVIRGHAARGDRHALAGLAEAHATFARARRLLAMVRLGEASSTMGRAASRFRAAGSPYAAWAPVYAAIADRMAARIPRALARLAELERAAPSRGYAHLHGRLLWTRAVSQASLGKLDVARDDYLRAIDVFSASGEQANEAAMRTMLADALGGLGDYVGAWQQQERALAWRSAASPSTRGDIVLMTGALLALDENLPEAARYFHDVLVSADEQAGDAARLPEAYLHRANTYALLRRWPDVEADLRRAEAGLPGVQDGDLRERLAAEIHSVRAGQADGSEAIAAAGRAIEYFGAAGHRLRVVRLRIARARALASAGSFAGAEVDLRAAIDEFEGQRAQLRQPEDRTLSFEEGRSAYTEMVRLQAVKRGRPDLAWHYAERARIWPGQNRSRRTEWATADDTAWSSALPEGTIVFHYAVLEDRLLAWVFDRRSTSHYQRPLGRRSLEIMVSDLRRAIQARGSREEVSRHARPLYDALLSRCADRIATARKLVFIADGPLHRLPFAALVTTSGRYLIEEKSIEIASRITAREAPPRRERPLRILAVGDGHVPDGVRPRLTEADAEATAVARLYAHSRLLTGSAATERRFRDGLADSDVIHFAGHAVANNEHPQYAHLLLAPGPAGDDGVVFARDLESRSFAHTRVVVLASCSTATGRAVTGEGPLTLARPFLAGGAGQVVASLWAVDDQQAGALFHHLHTGLVAGEEPAEALRAAQMAAIRMTRAEEALAVHWAGVETLREGVATSVERSRR